MTVVVERHLQPVPDLANTDQRPTADIPAERVVLGAMMLSESAADEVFDTGLRADDFYEPAHGSIYAAVTSLLAKGDPADPVAVGHTMAAHEILAKVGGGPYLHTLIAAVPATVHAGWYAQVVRDKASRRRLNEAGVRICQLARDTGRDTPEAVNAAQQTLHGATVDAARSAVDQVGDLVDDVLAAILAENGPDRGLSTGLGPLDKVIGGLVPGRLTIVAGRPGMGKSVVAVDFARRAAILHDIPALVFSLEMTKPEIMQRIFSAECGVNISRIQNGGLLSRERELLHEGTPRIRKAPLFIDDTAPNDLASIRATCRRAQQRHGLGLVVIDYVQLVRPPVTRPERHLEVGDVSSGLKALSKELGVPVVACCQLNRASESRSDKRPQLTDLRESGSLEQDADAVVLLFRPDYHEQEHERAGEIDLIVAKNRHGPMETVTCAAQLDKSRVVDFDVPEEPR